MNALSLIHLHLALECKGIDAEHQLYRIPCANPDTVHRVYAVRCEAGELLFFRRDTPQIIRERLASLPFEDFFARPDAVQQVMAAHSPCMEMHIGRSYIFPDALDAGQYPDAVRLSRVDPMLVHQYDPSLDLHQKEVFGIIADGRVVSTCESARENDTAGEAWVRTLEPYRRKGYARQVTYAWGHFLQQQGKTPFYSHVRDNHASRALAVRLGLAQYIEDAGYA